MEQPKVVYINNGTGGGGDPYADTPMPMSFPSFPTVALGVDRVMRRVPWWILVLGTVVLVGVLRKGGGGGLVKNGLNLLTRK